MSKRIVENTELFNNIEHIRLEINEKINKILINLLSSENLNSDEIMSISGVLYCDTLNNTYKNIYNDNNDREIIDNAFILYTFIFKKYPNIYQHISKLCEDGNKIIYNLSLGFKAPDPRYKRVTIDNVCTLKECNKLSQKYVHDLINDLISVDAYDLLKEELNKKKLELNL